MRNRSHRCTGDDCEYCEAAIERAESRADDGDRDYDPGIDWNWPPS